MNILSSFTSFLYYLHLCLELPFFFYQDPLCRMYCYLTKSSHFPPCLIRFPVLKLFTQFLLALSTEKVHDFLVFWQYNEQAIRLVFFFLMAFLSFSLLALFLHLQGHCLRTALFLLICCPIVTCFFTINSKPKVGQGARSADFSIVMVLLPSIFLRWHIQILYHVVFFLDSCSEVVLPDL